MPKFDKPDSPNIIWGVNALEGDLTKPDDSYIQTGWTQVKPPYEYENYSMNKLYQGFAYYNQLGFPEWDSVTEYQANKSYVQASNNRVYKCIQTHTNRNPATSGNEDWWERLRFTEQEIKSLFNSNNPPPVFACRAWANFNGKTLSIRASGNIASVDRLSFNVYQITFQTPMPDGNYSVAGSCSQSSASATVAKADGMFPYDYTTSGFKIECYHDVTLDRDQQTINELDIISFQVVR